MKRILWIVIALLLVSLVIVCCVFCGKAGDRLMKREKVVSSILEGSEEYTVSLQSTKIAVLEKTKEYVVAQGCCSDGKYIYGVIRKSDDSGVIIRKHKLSDGSYVATSEELFLGHGNDLTYDAKNDRF